LAEAHGYGHVDADTAGHDLLRENINVRHAIRDRFGDDVFEGDDISRSKLGRLVFSSRAALADLNMIIHPAIIDECARRIRRLGEAGKTLVIVDAALLLEVPVTFPLDMVIALTADREVRVQRLLAAGGFDRSQIETRLDNQEHLEKSFGRADIIIDTDKTLDEAVAEVGNAIAGLEEATR